MIKRFKFGKPYKTEATVVDIEPCSDELTEFRMSEDSFIYDLSDSDIVYGLGEQVRGINKRGWQYVSWNYDNPHHQEDTRSLYGAHNFIIISGRENIGVFFDYPGELTWDIGYTRRDIMSVKPASMNLDLYIITGDSISDIAKQFRLIIGKSYLPPVWALGYAQSRWGYKNEKDIREVAECYKSARIPLDSIYMDIDYMDNYKDFTVNSERFADLKSLVDDMRANGIHLVPIIDAGVKIEEGYDIYEEGVANNYFCKDSEGKDFVGAVWPGKVHFPDFMNPDARKWFGMKYSTLTKLGIDGFWNDMNEPAIFYTEDRLADAFDKADSLKNTNIGIDEYFEFTGIVGGLNGNRGDYDKFYHNVNGEKIRHSDIHNLYGMNMTRAASEALEEICPDGNTLFFSRSSYIGAHRYGGIWQGDNKSWWSHILQAMQQLPALNMAGFMFVGCDVGGFGCDTTEDLMMRYLQYAMFTPLMRNHSAMGTREQELYRFSTVSDMREMIRIRYCLIPYLYATLCDSISENNLMYRPLAFEFTDDEQAREVEDQLLLGDELMIAPIYRQNANGRYVYLPEEMMLIRMRRFDDYDKEILAKGHHYIKANLNELIFFIRKGKNIPYGKPVDCTRDMDMNPTGKIGY